MNVIANKKRYLSIATAMVCASIVALYLYPLNLGIDFTGGSLIEVSSTQTDSQIEEALALLNLEEVSVRQSAEGRFIIKTIPLTQTQHDEILVALGNPEELRSTSIGPTLGQELKRKGVYAIVWVVLLIIAYIAFVFRSVSRPVQSWKYGIVAIVALLHDILIPLGIFAVLGALYAVVIDSLFITALLAILGLSINDTIVVFDRIRENLEKKHGDFAQVVQQSVQETFVRSLNTSITTLLVLLALMIWGPESTRYFVLALMLGLIAGTYSSLFVASPLLVLWQEHSPSSGRKKKKK
ncbi:MAG: protein translocase subunit SecF [bacterium]|nr:protein translocase subunit SecF [bacterium]